TFSFRLSPKNEKLFESLHESQAVGFLHGAKENTLSRGVFIGSVGRDRTYDQSLTFILKLLKGMDYITSIFLFAKKLRTKALPPK
ncbi:MAG: hypothetical protein WC241_01655, partial [Candidatus Paceibacterota bacterium]